MKTSEGKHFLKEILSKPGIFYQILGSLVLLSVIITVLLAVFLSNLLYENKSRQIDEVSILRLEQAAETVETAVSSVQASLNSLHWDSELVNFSVNPASADISRNQRILQTMSHSHVNALVDEIYFVSCFSDQAFSSRGEMLSVSDDEALAEIWDSYLQTDRSEEEIGELHTRNSVFLTPSGQLCVSSELVVAQPISVLFCRINMETMSQMLRVNSEQPESYICVFGQGSEALLEDCYTYWCSGSELADSTRFLVSGEEARTGNIYYLYVSERDGWSYVSRRESSFRAVTGGELAAVLLPILVLVILVSLAFSWHITQSVYRPIGKLVELFTGQDPSVPPVRGDAFAYLEDAYRSMEVENHKVRSMAREFSEKILEDTMKKIIDGKLFSDEELEEIFAAIGTEVGIRDRFMVLMGHMEPPEAGISQNMEQNMYIISVYEILSSWGSSEIRVVPIYTYFDTIAAVLTASSRVSAIALKNEAVAVREKISQVSVNFPYHFYWGEGGVYEHISDLKYSYSDARQDLQYQMYHEGKSEITADEETDENVLYMEKRMAQITSELNEANREEAEALVTRTMEEIRENAASQSQAARMCERLCNILLEKMLSLHIPEEEVTNVYSRPIASILSETETTEETTQAAEKLCQESIWLIEMYSRKSKHVYVEEAEEYIQQHYSDSDLSQNEVAAYVGISPSYLSERFRKVTGKSFNVYLNNYRVEQAKLLLTTASVPVGEVGFLCGFSSPQNFSRVFRKITNMSPSQFRNQKQNSQGVKS